MPAPAAIELDGLGRDYGERAVLRDISLSVPRGATLAVFGANGAGKTTLLRVLATLLRPHAGRVHVVGGELPRDGWRVRGRIGFVGHAPLLYRELTGRENLRYHARLHGAGEARVEHVLGAVGMSGRADEPVRTLSRGMVQRLELGRAVLHEPDVLLLDEPFAHLDPEARGLVEPLIGAAIAATRVVTSHDPAADLAQADMALGLQGGRAALVAPAADVGPDELAGLYR